MNETMGPEREIVPGITDPEQYEEMVASHQLFNAPTSWVTNRQGYVQSLLMTSYEYRRQHGEDQSDDELISEEIILADILARRELTEA